jgi:hypothetical protein
VAKWAPFQTHWFSENLGAPGIEPGALDLHPGTLSEAVLLQVQCNENTTGKAFVLCPACTAYICNTRGQTGTEALMCLILVWDECGWLVSRSNHFSLQRISLLPPLEAGRLVPHAPTFYLHRKLFQVKVVGLRKSVSVVVKALCYKSERCGFETRWANFFNVFNPSGRTRPCGLLSLLTEMSTRRRKIMFWGVERCRCVGLTTLPPSVSRLSRQCAILNISQPYRPPQPLTEMALFYFYM